MVKSNKIKIIILSIFLLSILSYNVTAFGISSPYWDENPLTVHPGDVKEFNMILQNMVGDEDLTAEAKVNSGKDIMSILDQNTIYKVPLGSNNIPINLRVTVPQNAKPGQEFQVGVSVKTIAGNNGGVSLGSAVDKGFKVKVIEQPKPSTQATKTSKINSSIAGFIILIIILVLLIFIVRKFHKVKE